jgi:hypothetical protein
MLLTNLTVLSTGQQRFGAGFNCILIGAYVTVCVYIIHIQFLCLCTLG